MAELAPSLLSADFSKLGEDVRRVEKAGSHLLHMDIMDGHFVPNISYGPLVVKSLLNQTKVEFDVHLMVENPQDYIESFMTDNTKFITVHQEACNHLDRVISQIKNLGAKAGVALNPATPIGMIENILPELDLVLIMSVNPGFGGQKFIKYTLDKIKKLDEIRKNKKINLKIEVDGGITLENVEGIVAAGADIIVAGSSVFKEDNIEANVKNFLATI